MAPKRKQNGPPDQDDIVKIEAPESTSKRRKMVNKELADATREKEDHARKLATALRLLTAGSDATIEELRNVWILLLAR
jgi:hypothetical protein